VAAVGTVAALALAGAVGCDRNEDSGRAELPSKDEDKDEGTARAANLRLTDFPPGWERSPGGLRRLDTPDDLRFAECMGRPAGLATRTAAADSDNFSTGEFTRANSSAQVMRTEEIARDDLAALRTERAVPCLRVRVDAELARQAPANGPPFQQQALERLDFATLGDDTAAFRSTVSAPSVGPGVVLIIDHVFIRKGRVELSVAFVQRDAPFPNDLEQSLLGKMLGRV
jgi:hypothetical protein